MSEEMIVKHCAPTLAGLKTANVFSCEYESPEQLRREIIRLNRLLSRKGIRVVPLRRDEKRVLIYAYRPARLRQDLSAAEAAELLAPYGYRPECVSCCVTRLANRLRAQEGFPHEIGLFLGYPPEDVRGFIENKAKNYKCNGVWKVYGNEHDAKRAFARYQKCTDVYLRHYAGGKSIDRLAVSHAAPV